MNLKDEIWEPTFVIYVYYIHFSIHFPKLLIYFYIILSAIYHTCNTYFSQFAF